MNYAVCIHTVVHISWFIIEVIYKGPITDATTLVPVYGQITYNQIS